MKRNSVLASAYSFVVPGLGQMYCGYSSRGALILVAAILMYNLNSIFLPVFIMAHPDTVVFWKHLLPRILHDVGAFYSIVFWIWETTDAYKLAKGKVPT